MELQENMFDRALETARKNYEWKGVSSIKKYEVKDKKKKFDPSLKNCKQNVHKKVKRKGKKRKKNYWNQSIIQKLFLNIHWYMHIYKLSICINPFLLNSIKKIIDEIDLGWSRNQL